MPGQTRILTFTVAVEASYIWKDDEFRGRIEQILRSKLDCSVSVTRTPEPCAVEPTPGTVRSRKAKTRRAPTATEQIEAHRPPVPNSKLPPPRPSNWNETLQQMFAVDHGSPVLVETDGHGVMTVLDIEPHAARRPPESLGEIAERIVGDIRERRPKLKDCCHKTHLKGSHCEGCPYHD